ncbi:glycosyltransferase family 2 protein [Sphingomonas sp. BIUV-7]|uniref:Glycosyltransferase family 2 protein n=1 Tax=Sphingomonas natans TaxID=3063330 RepID=A0ABT8YCY0_9SPHN|nr:glycosyltransferase family 2 protein [Sphingomonas sp. BIUV-7]MDO6416179.1 glycosyltransferase family 2 protein [Sphingomonas sp. BIUV-7]
MTADSRSPLAVIVTPVYNGDAFLAAAMECVQAQTYDNLLHIVLDNASTDRTPEILDRYRNATVPVIVYRNNTVLPLTDNWDRAFSFIPRRARYAKLLCADDLMAPDCMRRFVELSEAHPSVQTVSCQDVHCDLLRRANIPLHRTVVDGVAASRAILDRSIAWLPFQHLFVRLHSIDFDQPFFGTHEYGADPYAVVRAALRGDFGYIHEPLVYSRRHTRAASNSLAADDRRPLYARQVNMMLLTYFKMILVFGERCWSVDRYARARRFAQRNLARTALKWRLRGFSLAHEELRTELAAVGHSLGLADYLAAIFDFPGYCLWKLRWRTAIGPSVSEQMFLSRHTLPAF